MTKWRADFLKIRTSDKRFQKIRTWKIRTSNLSCLQCGNFDILTTQLDSEWQRRTHGFEVFWSPAGFGGDVVVFFVSDRLRRQRCCYFRLRPPSAAMLLAFLSPATFGGGKVDWSNDNAFLIGNSMYLPFETVRYQMKITQARHCYYLCVNCLYLWLAKNNV